MWKPKDDMQLVKLVFKHGVSQKPGEDGKTAWEKTSAGMRLNGVQVTASACR